MLNSWKRNLCASLAAVVATLGVAAQEQPKLVFPSAPFNKAETMARLEVGKSSLKGYVGEKKRNRANTFNNIKVSLFPCTPYFEEYHELRKRHRGKDTLAAMTSEAFSYRIETTASNQDGSFEFQNLKPGKYFLTCNVTVGRLGHYDVQTGTRYETTTTLLNGVHPVSESTREIPLYTTYSYIYNTNAEKSEFAEINSDGQVVEVEL